MAPTIQAQHVVAVTIPTIAVIFLTYLWYKKRSNSVTRGRSDPGGGTSKKRNRHRNTVPSLTSVTSGGEQESTFPEAMKSAMQKAMRDLETAAPIQEICSDSEEFGEKEPAAAKAAVASTDVVLDGIVEEVGIFAYFYVLFAPLTPPNPLTLWSIARKTLLKYRPAFRYNEKTTICDVVALEESEREKRFVKWF